MKKKSKIFIVFGIILIFAILIYLSNINIPPNKIKKVCIENKKCFDVEVVYTIDKMTIGLSGRNSLNQSNGMLFFFQNETVPGFWMKDMLFPLDIIWINADNKIIGFEKNLQICSNGNCTIYYPNKNIKYVLEINSNLSDYYGFSQGDRVFFQKA